MEASIYSVDSDVHSLDSWQFTMQRLHIVSERFKGYVRARQAIRRPLSATRGSFSVTWVEFERVSSYI
eukprot:scaffold528821_cov53-Prasinocladus_malaysianus.AAC.1